MFELKKIGIVKRASALLLDAILLAVLATGLIYIISIICNYSAEENKANNYYSLWNDFRQEYIPEIAEHYGFKYEESDDGINYTITNIEDGKKSTLDELINVFISDVDRENTPLMVEAYSAYEKLPSVKTVNAQYKYVYTLLFTMVSIGVLLAYLMLEFIIPLILKNGQTIGKKVFTIGLVRPNCVKITNLSLFARTIIGKFAIETMFPILLIFLFLFGGLGSLAVILFGAIILFNIILFFATKNKTPIHDIIASTVTVDIKLQEFFQTEEELIQKKSQSHKDYISS